MSEPPSWKPPYPDDLLWTMSRMYLNGDVKQLEPDEIADICRRLLEFLPDPLGADGRGQWPSKGEQAHLRVKFLVERLKIDPEEARRIVARKMGKRTAQVAQHDRDHRGKKH